MLKKFKKLTTILLAGVMVFAMAMPAFAATPSASDTGSITINGLEEGVTASAYQIAKATYDSSGNFTGYEMTVSSDDTTWKIDSDGSWDNPDEADLAALFKALGDNPTASGSAQVDMGDDSATITGLDVGSYLVVITTSHTVNESVVYGMMIGSISYAVDETTGEWKIDNGSIEVEDCELWAKATTPTITKTEYHNGSEATHGESASVGDEITFVITINNIPSYLGDYPLFEIYDWLAQGFTCTNLSDNLKITIGDITLVYETDYVIQDKGNEFTLDFVVNGYTLNNYAGETLRIEYTAIVDDASAYNQDGVLSHVNNAELLYASTSYENSIDNQNRAYDSTYEYTFSMKAQKTDADENALAGATFGLFTDNDCNTAYTQSDEAVTATSASDGTIAFSGLSEGTYYIKETQAPAGYALNSAVYKALISAEYNIDGTLANWSITITDEKDNAVSTVNNIADTGVAIVNTKVNGSLPNTGGRGALIFTLIGCAVVICAGVGVAVNRRKKVA